MYGPWIIKINNQEFRGVFKSLPVSGVETIFMISDKEYLVRWESSLKTLFIRRPQEHLETSVGINNLEWAGTDSSASSFKTDLNMTSCPPSHIRAEFSRLGPDSLFRKKLSREKGLSIESPMNGKVLKVLVSKGSPVREGDVIAVVEAMKMENNIHAPESGQIGQILIKEGQAVQAGETLATIESGSSEGKAQP